MLAAKGKPVKAAHMVVACQLFGVSENHVRVALTRLSAEGHLKSVSRGVYALGTRAAPTGDDVRDWSQRLGIAQAWNGQFIVAITTNLGRKDRQQVQARERALGMHGFKVWLPGVFVRPDNLAWGIDGLHARLLDKGVEPDLALNWMTPRNQNQAQEIQALWDARKLERLYKSHLQKMQNWLKGYQKMALERAAREAYLVGSEAIYQVRHDPLLPDAWIDRALRDEFFAQVEQFNALGQQIWHDIQIRILKDGEAPY